MYMRDTCNTIYHWLPTNINFLKPFLLIVYDRCLIIMVCCHMCDDNGSVVTNVCSWYWQQQWCMLSPYNWTRHRHGLLSASWNKVIVWQPISFPCHLTTRAIVPREYIVNSVYTRVYFVRLAYNVNDIYQSLLLFYLSFFDIPQVIVTMDFEDFPKTKNYKTLLECILEHQKPLYFIAWCYFAWWI